MTENEWYGERKTAIHMLRSGISVNEVAERLNRSIPWVYKWWNRFKTEGWAGLHSRSRAPKHSPNRLVEAVRQSICQARSELEAEALERDGLSYIGAGAIATGGLLSLAKIMPILLKTVHIGTKELFAGFKTEQKLRTDKDISLAYLILGALAIILTLWLLPALPMNFFTILLLIILGFFFIAVTSITVGIIGSSSNPAGRSGPIRSGRCSCPCTFSSIWKRIRRGRSRR